MGCWWMHYDVCARETHTPTSDGDATIVALGEKFTLEASRAETVHALSDEMRIVFAFLFMVHRFEIVKSGNFCECECEGVSALLFVLAQISVCFPLAW